MSATGTGSAAFEEDLRAFEGQLADIGRKLRLEHLEGVLETAEQKQERRRAAERKKLQERLERLREKQAETVSPKERASLRIERQRAVKESGHFEEMEGKIPMRQLDAAAGDKIVTVDVVQLQAKCIGLNAGSGSSSYAKVKELADHQHQNERWEARVRSLSRPRSSYPAAAAAACRKSAEASGRPSSRSGSRGCAGSGSRPGTGNSKLGTAGSRPSSRRSSQRWEERRLQAQQRVQQMDSERHERALTAWNRHSVDVDKAASFRRDLFGAKESVGTLPPSPAPLSPKASSLHRSSAGSGSASRLEYSRSFRREELSSLLTVQDSLHVTGVLEPEPSGRVERNCCVCRAAGCMLWLLFFVRRRSAAADVAKSLVSGIANRRALKTFRARIRKAPGLFRAYRARKAVWVAAAEATWAHCEDELLSSYFGGLEARDADLSPPAPGSSVVSESLVKTARHDWKAFRIPPDHRRDILGRWYAAQMRHIGARSSSFAAVVKSLRDEAEDMAGFIQMCGIQDFDPKKYVASLDIPRRQPALLNGVGPVSLRLPEQAVLELIALAAHELRDTTPFQDHPGDRCLPAVDLRIRRMYPPEFAEQQGMLVDVRRKHFGGLLALEATRAVDLDSFFEGGATSLPVATAVAAAAGARERRREGRATAATGVAGQPGSRSRSSKARGLSGQQLSSPVAQAGSATVAKGGGAGGAIVEADDAEALLPEGAAFQLPFGSASAGL